eukprot:scaffold25288_cov112-Isochrysis_galbana.AAC.9
MEHLGVHAEDEEQHPGLDAAAGEPEEDVDTLSEGSDKLVGTSLHKVRGPDGGAVAHEAAIRRPRSTVRR